VSNSALSWEFAEETGAGVSQAGSRWFAAKFELIGDVKAIDVEFDLIEGVKAVWGCFDVEIESVFWAVGWEFADKAVGGVSEAGSRWFAAKFELIEDVKAIDVKFELVELKFADVEFAESGVSRSKFEAGGAGSSEFEAEGDSGVNGWFDVDLTVLIEANAEIAVEVGRGLYSSAQCVPIRCILQNVSPLWWRRWFSVS